MSSNIVNADINLVGVLGIHAVERAIANAIYCAEGIAGIPGYRDMEPGLL